MEFGELIVIPIASYISFSWTFSWHILVPTRIGCSNLHRHHLLELPDVSKAFQLLGRICNKNANILMAICQLETKIDKFSKQAVLARERVPLVSIFMFLLFPSKFTLTEEADLRCWLKSSLNKGSHPLSGGRLNIILWLGPEAVDDMWKLSGSKR